MHNKKQISYMCVIILERVRYKFVDYMNHSTSGRYQMSMRISNAYNMYKAYIYMYINTHNHMFMNTFHIHLHLYLSHTSLSGNHFLPNFCDTLSIIFCSSSPLQVMEVCS